MLLNYQSNALKFTPKGGSVIIKCSFQNLRGPFGSVQIEVIDTGIGISNENQSNLFQLYGFVKDTRELNPKGIGLGLHICKKICTQFDGEVGVQSKLGVGSQFRFVFQLDQIQENAQQEVCRIRNPDLSSSNQIIIKTTINNINGSSAHCNNLSLIKEEASISNQSGGQPLASIRSHLEDLHDQISMNLGNQHNLEQSRLQ